MIFCTSENNIRVKTAEFVSHKMSYRVLEGHWCAITVLNTHAPTQDKSVESKDNLYEKLKQVLITF